MEWISVKDRLPEDSREVLVAMKYSLCPIQAYLSSRTRKWHVSYEVLDSMVYNSRDSDTEMSSQDLITHWMELPPLPVEPK